MIILITCWDEEINQEVVSHGIDSDTDKNVVLPWLSPRSFGAHFDNNIGHWVIPDKAPKEKI